MLMKLETSWRVAKTVDVIISKTSDLFPRSFFYKVFMTMKCRNIHKMRSQVPTDDNTKKIKPS